MKKQMLSLFFFFAWTSLPCLAIDINNTRMLSMPAISRNHIAFIYGGELWVAGVDGSFPRRLSSGGATISNPYISPDGKTISFGAQYEATTDIYTIPVEGGLIKRLTWHPANDENKGFAPDGLSVLFTSPRNSPTGAYTGLFSVPIKGGAERQIKIPNADRFSYSADRRQIAYNPIRPAFSQWKNYRGGKASRIVIFSFEDNSSYQLPKPEGGCNDFNPVFIGQEIYFLSDRNGEFNLFSYMVPTKQIRQVTFFTDFPIVNASAGDNKIILEQAGYLHVFDLSKRMANKLTIGISADLPGLNRRWVKGSNFIRSVGISPSGARAVLDFRGDIFTVPAEKGSCRNITTSTGVHENSPAWSPDGGLIAYFSDAGGEYNLHVRPHSGEGDTRIFKLGGSGFYAFPKWSPDSKKITFCDNGLNLYVIDITNSLISKIDSDEYSGGGFRDMAADWSFDSKWIVYTKITGTKFKRMLLYNIDEKKKYAVTDGFSDVNDPVFDKSGRYIFFLASTDAGPILNGYDQSSIIATTTKSLYMIALQRGIVSPFLQPNDQEKKIADKEEELAQNGKAKNSRLVIDLQGIDKRIITIPIQSGDYQNLRVTSDSTILYLDAHDGRETGMMHKYSLRTGMGSAVAKMDEYVLSADGKKMLCRLGDSYFISNAGEKTNEGKGQLDIGGLQVNIEPALEWAAMFDEAWRINRDYFYDEDMHGADWAAIKKKYGVFLPDLACRDDLNTLLRWMFSELSVGHHFITNAGDRLHKPEPSNVGLLGGDFEIENNRYRIKKIYGHLNWNPEFKPPLSLTGMNAQEGDYLLAINGKDIFASESLYSYFDKTVGVITELTIGPAPDFKGSRKIQVVPIASEMPLRKRDWVEGNLRKVTEATKGKVAYVYVPDTHYGGLEYFRRYFYPQADRQAIIIDERFNGGGLLADYIINLLRAPYVAYWHKRYGKELRSPGATILGPKVMICNESAGSGGDFLPWVFKKMKLGTLVGEPTMGAMVGFGGMPELLDGGMVSAPNLGGWTKEEGFIIENEGVRPDVTVEQTPAEVIKGIDPQLQKAIDIALEELKKNPPAEPARPAMPVRVRK